MIKNYAETLANKTDSALPMRIYLYSPNDEELEDISRKSGIAVALMKLALDQNALSRIHKNHVTYAIFDIPVVYGGAKHQRVKTYPVGLFFKEGAFIAISHISFPIISETLADPEMKGITNEELFLHLVFSISKVYIQQLSHIDKETEILEDQMKRRVKNTEIFQLMEYQRSLTAMTTSLRGLKRMLGHMKEKNYCQDQTDILEDSIVASEQAGEMAEIFNDDLNALMDGFGSVISNSVNQIMKILTALTLILSIPMVIAGLYGMNVRLPLANDYNAFWYVCGLSTLIAMVTTIWFYFKKML